MSADFLKCIADGGKVTTVSLKGGKYFHVCKINGKSYTGETKTKKGEAKK
jgi:hypothetical protein